MTRAEAIEVLKNGSWWDLLIPVTTIEGRIEDDKLREALDLAIAALRPVSREMVILCRDCRFWQDNNGGYPRKQFPFQSKEVQVYDVVRVVCFKEGEALKDGSGD